MTALAAIILGTLTLGIVVDLSGGPVSVDVSAFGTAYGAELGLCVVLALRCFRDRPRFGLRMLLPAAFIVAALVVGAIEFHVVRDWAFHAGCESLYGPTNSDGEPHPALRRDKYLLHSRLRQHYRRALLHPWANRPPAWSDSESQREPGDGL